jgi:hypothetical protein
MLGFNRMPSSSNKVRIGATLTSDFWRGTCTSRVIRSPAGSLSAISYQKLQEQSLSLYSTGRPPVGVFEGMLDVDKRTARSPRSQ